uniref:hypothetical protein n=1 Tax=Klebsiella quasipneumoniae TaxID=1463165 RepID=UPI001D0D9CC6
VIFMGTASGLGTQHMSEAVNETGVTINHAQYIRNPRCGNLLEGVLGIFRPKTTKCSGGRAVRGLQRGITFR